MIESFRARFRALTPLRRVLLCLTAVLLVAAEVLEACNTRYPPTAAAEIAAGLLGLLALALPRGRSARALLPAATLSCAVSVTTTQLAHRPENTPGMVEMVVLLLLAAQALRTPSLLRGTGLACAAGLAVALVPLRLADLPASELEIGEVMLFLTFAVAVALGCYLRLLDSMRAREYAAGLQAQRLEYARELHDFVAHHVTAIVAQAKAVRYTAAAGHVPEPDALDGMLARIEHAGGEALGSMRGMVSVLRGKATTGPGPAAGAGSLRELVDDFSAVGPPAELVLDPRLADGTLPAGVAETAHRVVRESLTNIRRHAPDAGRVTVDVRLSEAGGRGRRLELAVVNDGRTPPREGQDSRPGGGYGLVGLTERVTAAGGELSAGPRDATHWEVTARFPLPAQAAGRPTVAPAASPAGGPARSADAADTAPPAGRAAADTSP